MGALTQIFGTVFGKLNELQRQRMQDAEKLMENRERERDEARAEVAELKQENARLRQRLAALPQQQEQVKPDVLPAETVKVLRYIVQHKEAAAIEEIAHACRIDVPKAKYHVDGLVKRKFVYAHLNMRYPPVYSALPDGRAYIFEVADDAASASG